MRKISNSIDSSSIDQNPLLDDSGSFSFIGAGRVGTALGVYFREKGFKIQGYFSRTSESAGNASLLTDSQCYPNIEKLVADSQIIWITTPDDAIESVAMQLSNYDITEKKMFIHVSGLKTSDALDCLKKQGHRVCSAHPLLAFGNTRNAVKMLQNTTFFIEGDEPDLNVFQSVLSKIGNKFFKIDKRQKPIYHTGAVIISNYLVTLYDATDRIFDIADIEKTVIKEATNVLIESVLENLKTKSTKEALTGPIKRNDMETVKKHLEILEKELPELAELYKALGNATMNMIGDYRLKDTLN